MVFEFDAASSPSSPDSPSNSSKIIGPHEATFSATDRLRKPFGCNTYELPRKCCKQKTYGMSNSFRCNTYKKHGCEGWDCLPPSFNRHACPFFSYTYELQI